MLAAFFLTPFEIVAGFITAVLGLLGIGSKVNSRKTKKNKKRKK
jgi:hypothetical protein